LNKRLGALAQRIGVQGGLRADGIDIVRQPGAGDLLAVSRVRQPALDQRLVDLRVKLHAVGRFAIAEGLLLAATGCAPAAAAPDGKSKV
jgi:hypothetical protein